MDIDLMIRKAHAAAQRLNSLWKESDFDTYRRQMEAYEAQEELHRKRFEAYAEFFNTKIYDKNEEQTNT